MIELIAAGFDDRHTAFLARATLARLQTALSLSGGDVVVVTREKEGRVSVYEETVVNDGTEMNATFWDILANLVFGCGRSEGTDEDTASPKLTSIGIDAAFSSRAAQCIRPGTAALFVLVRGPAMRERVLGMLRGSQGEIVRTPLAGDDREALRRTLLSTSAGEAQ